MRLHANFRELRKSEVEVRRIPLPRTPVNKDEKQGLRYGPPHPRRVCCTLFVRSPSNPPDGRGAYVRQPNLQGSDRRVRRHRRDRIVWSLLLARDGRFALSAVRALFGALCDVHSRVLLVDCLWAGTQPGGALRPLRVGRLGSVDSLSIIDTRSGLSCESPYPRSLGARNSRVVVLLRVVTS